MHPHFHRADLDSEQVGNGVKTQTNSTTSYMNETQWLGQWVLETITMTNGDSTGGRLA